MRAPGDLGNATVIPGARPTPANSSVPRAETWWGLALQWAAGTQLTLTMRTLVMCPEGALAVAGALAGGEEPPLAGELPPAAGVPPALAASAGSARAANKHSDSAMAAPATNLDRLWAPVLAKTGTTPSSGITLRPIGRKSKRGRRPPTLSVMGAQTAHWHGSCACAGVSQVSHPQRKPAALGA